MFNVDGGQQDGGHGQLQEEEDNELEEEKVNKKDYKRRWRMLSSDSMAWLGGCLWRKEASVALSNLSNCQLPISQFAWKLQEAVERLR